LLRSIFRPVSLSLAQDNETQKDEKLFTINDLVIPSLSFRLKSRQFQLVLSFRDQKMLKNCQF
jgi:hypothetical protein